MSKHTPGPWVAQQDPHGVLSDWMVGTPDGKPDDIAVCEEHNARLIAAAPELLAALEKCAAVCAGDTTTKGGLIAALEAARTALSKAKGEA